MPFYWVERGGQAEGRLGRVRIFAFLMFGRDFYGVVRRGLRQGHFCSFSLPVFRSSLFFLPRPHSSLRTQLLPCWSVSLPCVILCRESLRLNLFTDVWS